MGKMVMIAVVFLAAGCELYEGSDDVEAGPDAGEVEADAEEAPDADLARTLLGGWEMVIDAAPCLLDPVFVRLDVTANALGAFDVEVAGGAINTAPVEEVELVQPHGSYDGTVRVLTVDGVEWVFALVDFGDHGEASVSWSGPGCSVDVEADVSRER